MERYSKYTTTVAARPTTADVSGGIRRFEKKRHIAFPCKSA
jgi:hypothetical protein